MQPSIYTATDHDIDPQLIDPDALNIVHRLKRAGFPAYIVGGSVRDLLAKRRPKDFDISTAALPEEIKALFQRQCILIGRRFRLAHVRFGKKVFEVSTFRSGESEGDLIVHDNEWGTPEEDVMRRDFTINGLFYDPEQHQIIDYVDGWKDIHQGLIRSIGDPVIRFHQDPVRMLRLLKFQARFGFAVDPATQQALVECKEEIIKSSPARILEEILRMLESGASAPFFRLLLESGLLDRLFPPIAKFLKGPEGEIVYSYLTSADKVCEAYGAEAVDRSILTACLLYPIFENEVRAQFLDQQRTPTYSEIVTLCSVVIRDILIASFSHFPRRISVLTSHIIASQYRLTPFSGRKNLQGRFAHHKDFHLALKFFKLRAMVDPNLRTSYEEWKNVFRKIHHHAKTPSTRTRYRGRPRA